MSIEDRVELYASVTAEITDLCQAVKYKTPGKPETWDEYHKGQADLADKILDLLEEL